MIKEKRQRSPIKESKEDQLYGFISKSAKYSAFKYKCVIYKLGDFLKIKKNGSDQIGKLISIIPYNGMKEYNWPSIKVQWYYNTTKIRKKTKGLDPKKAHCIGKYEVFSTNHTEIILIEDIDSKCHVIPIELYLKLSNPSSNIYVKRAHYDTEQKFIDPPLKKWKTVCICKTPLNPDDYLVCEICKNYFHPNCVNEKGSELQQVKPYFCMNCKGNDILGNSEEALTKEI